MKKSTASKLLQCFGHLRAAAKKIIHRSERRHAKRQLREEIHELDEKAC